MGMIASRLGGYQNVFMMNTESQVHFAWEVQQWMDTARSTQRMQDMAHVMATVNNANGGGAGGGNVNWGSNWIGFASMIRAYAPWMIVAGSAGAGVTYAVKGPQVAMAVSIFLATFFLVNFIGASTYSQMINMQNGRTFWASVFVGVVAAFIVGFLVYDPKK